jgi:HPt (histidine-containing phosphotransfer) domain-containing protein
MKVVVQVDPDLIDLMPGFLANKRLDADKIAAAAEAADYSALRGMGHKIKGEGGSYGFDGISEIGAQIERAATDKDLATVLRCASELMAYLDSVELVFE